MSSSSSEKQKREKVISLMMNRASINPMPSEIKPIVQLSTTSKAIKEEMESLLPKKTLRKAYWENMVDNIIKKGKPMQRVIASPTLYSDYDDFIVIDANEIYIKCRSTRNDLMDAIAVQIIWDGGKISKILSIFPFEFDGGYMPLEDFFQIIHKKYYHENAMVKDYTDYNNPTKFHIKSTTEWRGPRIVNLIAAMIFGFSKAKYLKNRMDKHTGELKDLFPTAKKYMNISYSDDPPIDMATDNIMKDSNKIAKGMSSNERVEFKKQMVDMLLKLPDRIASDMARDISLYLKIKGSPPRKNTNSKSSSSKSSS